MKTGKLLLIRQTCNTSYFVTLLTSYFLYYSVFTSIFARMDRPSQFKLTLNNLFIFHEETTQKFKLNESEVFLWSYYYYLISSCIIKPTNRSRCKNFLAVKKTFCSRFKLYETVPVVDLPGYIIFSIHWMRLSIIWKIMQIEKGFSDSPPLYFRVIEV